MLIHHQNRVSLVSNIYKKKISGKHYSSSTEEVGELGTWS